MGKALCEQVDISQLAAYGGWNTAGNTLGTVLAQAVIRHVQKLHGTTDEALAAHAQFLYLRFVEDYLYMAHLRSKVMLELLPMLGVEPTLTKIGDAEDQVVAHLTEALGMAAIRFGKEYFVDKQITAGTRSITIQNLTVKKLWLSWGRLFDLTTEIDVGYNRG